jgi:hypothetical protein
MGLFFDEATLHRLKAVGMRVVGKEAEVKTNDEDKHRQIGKRIWQDAEGVEWWKRGRFISVRRRK